MTSCRCVPLGIKEGGEQEDGEEEEEIEEEEEEEEGEFRVSLLSMCRRAMTQTYRNSSSLILLMDSSSSRADGLVFTSLQNKECDHDARWRARGENPETKSTAAK